MHLRPLRMVRRQTTTLQKKQTDEDEDNMAKNPQQNKPETPKPIELSEAERRAKITKALRTAAPRVLDIEIDFEAMSCVLVVPPPREMDPRATLEQRSFFAEVGLTKVERATVDYLAGGELKHWAGGELAVSVRISDPAHEARP
jgi:hypothetical protein